MNVSNLRILCPLAPVSRIIISPNYVSGFLHLAAFEEQIVPTVLLSGASDENRSDGQT